MASTFSLQVKGLDKLINQFKKIPVTVQDGLDRSMNAAANQWVNQSVRDAPVYDGKLKSAIRSHKEGFLFYQVSANVFYAAYIEFGTKKKVSIPAGLEAIAGEFKGGGGSFRDLLKNIELWVRKQGIGGTKTKSGKQSRSKASISNQKSVAFLIARSIATNGIRPHPYFFKQKASIEQYLENEVAQIEKQIQV